MLVGERETCKVTDFGMARDVQQDNIYEKKNKCNNLKRRIVSVVCPNVLSMGIIGPKAQARSDFFMFMVTVCCHKNEITSHSSPDGASNYLLI